MVRTKAVIAVLTVALPLLAATKMYEVTPYRNCINETPRNTPISQTFVNVVDSLTVISLWVGDRANGEAFSVVIKDEDEVTVAHRSDFPAPGQSWTGGNIGTLPIFLPDMAAWQSRFGARSLLRERNRVMSGESETGPVQAWSGT